MTLLLVLPTDDVQLATLHVFRCSSEDDLGVGGETYRSMMNSWRLPSNLVGRFSVLVEGDGDSCRVRGTVRSFVSILHHVHGCLDSFGKRMVPSWFGHRFVEDFARVCHLVVFSFQSRRLHDGRIPCVHAASPTLYLACLPFLSHAWSDGYGSESFPPTCTRFPPRTHHPPGTEKKLPVLRVSFLNRGSPGTVWVRLSNRTRGRKERRGGWKRKESNGGETSGDET